MKSERQKISLFLRGRPFITYLASAAIILGSLTVHASEPMHVMIDPGHGGSDNGANRGSLKEKEITLKVSLALAELLRSDSRFKVSMTRDSDRKISLTRRTQLAEDAKAELFVSIHINSSTDLRARGSEIYFQNQLPADEEALYLVSKEAEGEDETPISEKETLALKEPISVRTDLKRILEDLNRNFRIQTASELAKLLIETLAKKNTPGRHAIRQAPFQVVTKNAIPSVLIELGFISHPQEGPLLAQATHQRELAKTLYEGLTKYKETVDKDLATNLHSNK